jgi:hypothetical protein
MVVLHRRGGVELRQVRARLDLERVVGAAVVEIVAEAGDHQRETLNLRRRIKTDNKVVLKKKKLIVLTSTQGKLLPDFI